MSDAQSASGAPKVPIKPYLVPAVPGLPRSRKIRYRAAGALEIHHVDVKTVTEDEFLKERIVGD